MRTIRRASGKDAGAMLEIYRPYVLETPISFEVAAPTIEDFRNRILETTRCFPWILLEERGEVLGYAYAAPFHKRQAYQWSAESTVYVRQNSRGLGVGRALYEELITQVRNMGIVNLVGSITMPNKSSITLHEKLGFVQVAHFKNLGFKMGEWWDVGHWQLAVQPALKIPPKLIVSPG